MVGIFFGLGFGCSFLILIFGFGFWLGFLVGVCCFCFGYFFWFGFGLLVWCLVLIWSVVGLLAVGFAFLGFGFVSLWFCFFGFWVLDLVSGLVWVLRWVVWYGTCFFGSRGWFWFLQGFV